MDIDRQIEIIEAQIHSEFAQFTLFEKMAYLKKYFGPDPEFSQEAVNIVIGNICKNMKGKQK